MNVEKSFFAKTFLLFIIEAVTISLATHFFLHNNWSVLLTVIVIFINLVCAFFFLRMWTKEIQNRISQFQDLESALIKAQANTEMANQTKTEFLANMSHEIRTPLNAIVGMADLLWETSLNSEQKKYVEIFRRAGDNLLKLINDILDVSKIEAGKISIENIDFDLQELVENLADLMAIKAQDKFIKFQCHIKPAVNTRLIGDPTRLRQSLLNLIGNAIKFTDKGSVTLEVDIDPDFSQRILFKVSDQGPGIPPEKQHLIFQKFSQTDGSVTRKYGGTGLGLAISKNLVELMGGDIGFYKNPDCGTSFYFSLPLIPQRGADANPRMKWRNQFKDQKVVIITGDDFIKALLRDHFEFWGQELFALNTVEQAKVFFNDPSKNCKIDLIVTDHGTFEESMINFLEGFTSPPFTLASSCIVISQTQSTQIAIEKSDSNPGLAYLCSPVKIQELRTTILRLLDMKRPPQKCVIFVDDEPDLRENFLFAAASEDWKVFTFQNGKEGLDFCLNNKVDLIFSDLNMPIMNGISFLEKIRHQDIYVPFIICSAFSDNEILEKAHQLNIDGVFEKPIGLNTLVEAGVEIFKKSNASFLPPPPSQPITPSSLNILLVDDSEDNRILIKSYLKGRPYNITEAENGQIAIDNFKNSSYDLIFMDMQMPVIDGLTATREIRKLETESTRGRISIIALTANATSEDKHATRAAGCDQHLSKPIKKQTLIELMNQFHMNEKRVA